jgi:hypothetical protein
MIYNIKQLIAGMLLSKTDKRNLTNLMRAVAPLMGSAVYDAASLADGAGVTSTITVTGAALGDFVEVSCSVSLQGPAFASPT